MPAMMVQTQHHHQRNDGLKSELLWPEVEFNPILLEEIDTRERLATPMSSNKNAAHHVEANRKSQR